MARLEEISDPRHQSYIVYSSRVLLATRILSAVFYIDSMRKTGEEFNSPIVIENIGFLCGEEDENVFQLMANVSPVCPTGGFYVRHRFFQFFDFHIPIVPHLTSIRQNFKCCCPGAPLSTDERKKWTEKPPNLRRFVR